MREDLIIQGNDYGGFDMLNLEEFLTSLIVFG